MLVSPNGQVDTVLVEQRLQGEPENERQEKQTNENELQRKRHQTNTFLVVLIL